MKPFAAILGTAVLCSAISVSTLTLAPPSDAVSEKKISKAIKVAKKQIGDPYVYGAEGPHAFDCSGLLVYSFGKTGTQLPRTANDLMHRARIIPKHKMRYGDLMGFEDGGHYYHIGMFVGWNGNRRREMVVAPRTGLNVQIEEMWTTDWKAGTLRSRR